MADKKEPLLSVQHLTKEFPVDSGVFASRMAKKVSAVQDVSFDIFPGETFGLVGESGCGKSITSLAIMGLLDKRARISGEILYNGENLLKLNDREMNQLRGREIAMIYQDALSSLNPSMLIKSQMKQLTKRGGTRDAEDLVEVVQLGGEEYLFYRALPIDWLLIRGTVADGQGNLTTTDEAMKLEVLPAVLATKRWGGKVVAQVRERVETSTLDPKDVTVPGVFVDSVVVCPDPETDHRMTSSFYFDPSFCGQARVPEEAIEPAPMNERKLIARRGVCELYPGAVVNLGTGIPNDMVGRVAAEEGLSGDVMVTVESGIYGGVQLGGVDFGIGQNLTAMVAHHEQFDYYDGAGVDVTFMGLGELDGHGNVNSTKMGDRCAGAGGFIDITQNAKKVVFLGTFTAKGGRYRFEDGRLVIEREGEVRKMVSQVGQLSFNGPAARRSGQDVLVVTERAVFRLVPEGVELIEIAPGIDLKTQVLDLMGFEPIVSPDLKVMDPALFTVDGPAGIALGPRPEGR